MQIRVIGTWRAIGTWRLAVRAVVLAGLVLAGLAVPATGLHAAPPVPADIAFQVFRGAAPIGYHRVRFRQDGGTLYADIDIELDVKLFFVTIFRYRHRNREVWRDGRLVAIETETDDDGKSFKLSGRATADGFLFEGSRGRLLAPADIMPTSYWNPATPDRTQFLDTQKGRLLDLVFTPDGREDVAFGDRDAEARRFSVTGDLRLDLWYTPAGEWAKTAFMARGDRVTYVRQAAGPNPAADGTGR